MDSINYLQHQVAAAAAAKTNEKKKRVGWVVERREVRETVIVFGS